jgi:hypothetical protein
MRFDRLFRWPPASAAFFVFGALPSYSTETQGTAKAVRAIRVATLLRSDTWRRLAYAMVRILSAASLAM